MLNTVILGGRLTRAVEMRYTPSGIPVANFSLAVERDVKDGDGERKADFIECVAWRQSAEFVNSYFSKGSGAIVKGRLQIKDWTDANGQKRKSAEVICDNIYFMGGKTVSKEAETRTGTPEPYNGPGAFAEIGDEDGELPF